MIKLYPVQVQHMTTGHILRFKADISAALQVIHSLINRRGGRGGDLHRPPHELSSFPMRTVRGDYFRLARTLQIQILQQ